MKIWSLLPSATEILFALNLGDQVTGVTHECDYPPEAAMKPRVTYSNIDSGLGSAEIDRQVTEHFRAGKQLYGIDEGRLREDPPDLVVTQDLCPVCAVSPSDFAGHMAAAGCTARTVTLNPNTLDDVLASIVHIGDATERQTEARAFLDSLHKRIEAVRAAVADRPRKRVLTLEWLDPLMPGGHWVPEMISTAGGTSGPIEQGQPSRKFAWEDLPAGEADVIVLMPCGFDPRRSASEATALWRLPGWPELPAVTAGDVYTTDGNAYFSRPGPRLVEGIEILARILHPDAWHMAPPGSVLKLTSGDRPPQFREYT